MNRRRYLELVTGEPYRLLFPLGSIIGAVGVSLWPLFVYGQLDFYPGMMHARIMVQGFVFCFLAGFLGSALPHMLEVKGMPLGAIMMLAALACAVIAGHLLGVHAAADGLFAAGPALLMVFAARRWPARRDLPPPGFVLAVLGLISGSAGSLILAATTSAGFAPATQRFGALLLYHGFILLPVLGVGPYLLPRMFNLPNRHLIAPKSPHPSRTWCDRAAISLAGGVVVLAGLAIEARGQPSLGLGLRAAGAFFCLWHALPLHRVRAVRGSIPWALLIAIVSILAGLAVIAIWPHRMMTWLHLVFISGYGLLVLNIAARVMLGHSGQGELIYARSRASRWITGLALLAMATRVSADLLPRMQLSHYAYAAITWVVVTAIWLAVYGPLVREAPSDPVTRQAHQGKPDKYLRSRGNMPQR